MIPAPIAVNRFPRVSVSTADAVRDLASRRHLLQEPREILLSPFGRVVLRCVDTGAPSAYRKDCESWAIVRAGGSERPGALIVDSLAVLRLVNTALGLPPPRVGRSLGHSERGVAAAILAAVVRQFSDDLALSLRRSNRERDDVARITLALESGRYREFVHLHIPPRWLPLQRNRNIAAEAAQRELPLTFRVAIARTELTMGEWSMAAVGDAVVFEGTSFPEPSQPLTVELSCGSHRAEARLSHAGLAIVSSFQNEHSSSPTPQIQPAGPTPGTESRRESMRPPGEDRGSTAEALLAAAPIEVVAELGRLTLPAAEVLTLGPGSVLPLGWLRPESVELKVGDRTWARGELVDLDGQLAVRLTSVAGPPPSERPAGGDTQPIR